MHIRFGLDLDGEHGAYRTNELDAKTVGPLGFLDILETQLGLPHQNVSAIERVMLYRECLKNCDNPERFYHDTFAVDDIETAKKLLAWRDQWYLHGWTGMFSKESPKRLTDMEAVESDAIQKVPLSEGQRLAHVARHMTKRKVRITAVTLCDPLEWFPWSWQQILRNLPLDCPTANPSASTSSLLGQLQNALLSMTQGKASPTLRWIDDGSLVVVRSETTICSGHWLGAFLNDQTVDTLLVAPQAGIIAETLPIFEQPSPNFQELSSFRPALQFLPLVLSQLWSPVDVHSLIKFLTHSLCPIDREVRTKLADTVSIFPGIGGKPWRETLTSLENIWQTKERDWNEAYNKVRFWLEHERYPLDAMAPLEYVVERVNAVAEHFRTRLGDSDPLRKAVFQTGYTQVVAYHKALLALLAQGETHIGVNKLQGLMNQCIAHGAGNPSLLAEAGSCRKVCNPGAVIDPAERVIWWQMKAPALPRPYPWSFQEIAALHEAGVFLPGVTEELRREALRWQKPILKAQKQAALILPPAGQEVHPLWLMLHSLFKEEFKPHIKELEGLFRNSNPDCAHIKHKALPNKKRWWRLSKDINVHLREEESFSSQEAFLFNPYQWMLRYKAKLEPGKIATPSDTFQLFGTLSHTLVERYFCLPEALRFDDQFLRSWFQSAFTHLIQTEGASLLIHGHRSELQNFQNKLQHAMLMLQSQLREAKIIAVEPEIQLSGVFPGGKLRGYADLLVTRSDGRRAIIDMKWAGGKKYPHKLATNRHLQLALYGELVRQQYGTLPDLSYFIISQSKLIAQNNTFFPDALVITPNYNIKDHGAGELWNRFLVTWQWRRELLKDGFIEVAIDDMEVTEAPEEGLSLEILNQKYNVYLSLAGWREDQ